MTDIYEGVTIDKNILSGKPCIAGTRIPVDCVIEYAALGVDRFKDEYPTVTDRQIAGALFYVLTKHKGL